MCGIAGYAGAPSEETLRAMGAAIAHRGPDGEATFVGDGVGFVHRRLAIVDIATGAQPMANEDGRVVIVFNGEIYNHRELRPQLEAAGHRFRTDHSDTETILHGYEQWGLRGVCERLRGMFAFAIWDGAKRQLHLARDRAGKKPLFYAEGTEGRFAFASEIKALRPLPWWDRAMDEVALHHYLSLQYVPAPWTIHRGVRKLPPAHIATWDAGTGALSLERYWRLAYEPKRRMEDDEAVAATDAVLDEAVRVRLEAEVPMGVFLSGGVDSSAVVAYMRRHVTGPLRTFSIGFEEQEFNELPYARMVAKRYETQHEELIVRADAAETLPQLAWQFDEPFADASAIPTLAVCRAARRHVTVALNGDGGDESFGGYKRYNGFHPLPWWEHIPRPIRSAADPAFRALAKVSRRAALARYVNRVSLMSPDENYAQAMLFFLREQKRALYTPALRDRLHHIDTSREITIAAMRRHEVHAEADGFMASDVETYLPGALLPKVDRTSMSVGLEARSPFLDHKVMEFAARLTPHTKFPDSALKGLLKQTLEPLLPREVLHRRKAGFAIPMAAWLRGPLRGMVKDTLLDRTARERGLFRPEYVQRLVRDHLSGHMDHKRQLWALLNFELWARTEWR